MAHEIGHTLNMHHDFGYSGHTDEDSTFPNEISGYCGRKERFCPDKDFVHCTDVGGVMDYAFPVHSSYKEICASKVNISVDNFLLLYNHNAHLNNEH